MRFKQATREQKQASFDWCLEKALGGDYPPTETGLFPDTIYALEAVADAADQGRATDQLADEARHQFEVELGIVHP